MVLTQCYLGKMLQLVICAERIYTIHGCSLIKLEDSTEYYSQPCLMDVISVLVPLQQACSHSLVFTVSTLDMSTYLEQSVPQ